MKLKYKNIWALELLVKDQWTQCVCFRYKKEAIKYAKNIKWTSTRIEKRFLLTDKY